MEVVCYKGSMLKDFIKGMNEKVWGSERWLGGLREFNERWVVRVEVVRVLYSLWV